MANARIYTTKEIELISNPLLAAAEIGKLLNIHPQTVYRFRKQQGIIIPIGAKPGKPNIKKIRQVTRSCICKDCSTSFTVNQASKKRFCSPRCQMLTQNPSYKGMLRPIRNPNIEEYTRYARKVHGLSQKMYEKHKDAINPNNYPRTLCGVEGGWQLDHITPIKECFEKGQSPHEAAQISNLRMLPWKDNLMRQYKE
jgi:hypothetical protein